MVLGTTFNILLISLFSLIVLIIIGGFYPPILQYLSSLHIFDIIIIGCLIELLYLQSTRISENQRVIVFPKERNYYSDFLKELCQNHPHSVDFLSAGLSSRRWWISWLRPSIAMVSTTWPGLVYFLMTSDTKSVTLYCNEDKREIDPKSYGEIPPFQI